MSSKIKLSDISFRNHLLPGDLGFIAYIHGLLYAEECGYGLNFEAYVMGGLSEFAHQYDAAKDRIWICEHEQRIVGFLLAFYKNEGVQLRYFILLPAYRGIGLGKKLMEFFIGYMHEHSYKKAWLWTTNGLKAAAALYIRYGFHLTEQKVSTAFDTHLIEQRYDLALG